MEYFNVTRLLCSCCTWGSDSSAEHIFHESTVLVTFELIVDTGHISVYWRELRVRNKEGGAAAPHNPLQSALHPHLMSITAMFSSCHEGYLYHLPGHTRAPGRGLGVQQVAAYPFTSPVQDLVLEPSLLHALTETGLETYTLRSGYHTVREAECLDDRVNTAPPTSIPHCLIGLRPFLGVQRLLLGSSRLVLLAGPGSAVGVDWTLYSLHLPSHLDLYRDMLAVADMNVAAPHGHRQLLCEAHMVARVWRHRLAWLRAFPEPGSLVTNMDLEAVVECYQESCLRLAEHFLSCPDSDQAALATPYFRLSRLPPLAILRRPSVASCVQPGTTLYIKELVLHPTANENIMDAEVADKVINILGENDMQSLVQLVLASPALKGFKTKQTLDYIVKHLNKMNSEFSICPDMAVAAVLLGGTEDWLSLAPPVPLSSTLLAHHSLMFEPGAAASSFQSFSEFGLAVRASVPVIFVEVCVSLIESRLARLGGILQLLLQTFMTGATSPRAGADNAAVLQLFLETFFLEVWCDAREGESDDERLQALLTLTRSYLAGLLHPLPAPPGLDWDCETTIAAGAGEMFGPRPIWLEECGVPDQQQELPLSLLKLQSLLNSGLAGQAVRDTVLSYLQEQPGLPGRTTLQLLATPPCRQAVALLADNWPAALPLYCQKAGPVPEQLWLDALEELHCRGLHAERRSLLATMARTFQPEQLEFLLPDDEEHNEYLAECERLFQLERINGLIVSTGEQMLESLAL